MSGNGRLTEASLAEVRDRASIEAVVSDYVTLKRAGMGSLKGLCPFHDEKGPSFHVTPAKGAFFCFGCGEGGDVISFIQKIESIDFIEAVDRLADRFRVTLAYDETHSTGPSREDRDALRHQRTRLLEAHKIAAEFYTSQLLTPDAAIARDFLTARNFTRSDAEQFACGYSPNTWDTLIKYLGDHGYTPDEALLAGLASEGKNGPIDRFRGRLMWPIKDATGDVIGFGARKLHDSDQGPKYLNTPETALYKKNRVLYGLDTARRDIAKNRRAVIVEGYTDVMACHLAGETTAVATCGTAFGEEHIKVMRRLLGDDAAGGEVIFTFDGDTAGQKAALRAFEMDDHFQTHTFVAVEPSGMDPCDLRISHGNEGIRDLLDNRVPLFEFAIRSALARHDLTTAEGRVNALSETAPLVATIKNRALRPDYIRRLAGWLRIDVDQVSSAVIDAANRPANTPPTRAPHSSEPAPTPAPVEGPERPDPTWFFEERDALKVLLQFPESLPVATVELAQHAFAHPAYDALWHSLVAAQADPDKDTAHWVPTVQRHASTETIRSLVAELTVEPIATRTSLTLDYAANAFLAVAQVGAERRCTQIEQALTDPNLTDDDLTGLLDEISGLHRRIEEITARRADLDGTRF